MEEEKREKLKAVQDKEQRVKQEAAREKVRTLLKIGSARLFS